MIRAYADNVILKLDPLETVSGSGIVILDQTGLSGHRLATVVSSGPGYWASHRRQGPGTETAPGRTEYTADSGVFIPNETKPGDRVIIGKYAGSDFRLDLNVPRHNKTTEFQELFGEKGEFRIVREQEIEGIVEAADSEAVAS